MFDCLTAQEKIEKMDIDLRNIRAFTIKKNKDGSQTTELTPEHIKAYSEAGWTPDQVQNLMIEALRAQDSTLPKQISTVDASQITTNQKISDPITHNASGLLLSEAIELFKTSLSDNKQKDWKYPKNYDTFLRRLLEITDDRPVDDITIGIGREVFNDIKKLPANSAKYKTKKVGEIIKLIDEDEDEKTLSVKSINSHLELYKRLFQWTIDEHNTPSKNPFSKFRLEKNLLTKDKDARLPFSRSEISTIFSTQIFTNGEYEYYYQFWAPLIALFTGARRNEIASLDINDIYQDDNGIYVFDFNINNPKKKLKTATSIRKTPIHPTLLKIGLLDFVDSCNKQNKTRLFEELKTWSNKEGYGRNIGDWFNGKYLKELRIHIFKKKVYHSFRHTFATELDKKKVDISHIEQLSGREIIPNKTVGQKVYISDAETPALLEQLKKLDFDEELKKVKWIYKQLP